MIIQGVSYLSDFEAKKAIIAIAAKLYAKGWMTAGDGSISVRVGPNAVWMTLEGADKSALTMDKLIRIDLNGKQPATNKPKSLGEDLDAHLRVYRENERLRCVVHAYPVCTVALSASGKDLEAAAFTPSVRKLGRIRIVGPVSNEQSVSDIGLLSKNDSGVIIKNDGCMMWGADPYEAADRVEALDYRCESEKLLHPGCGRSSHQADGACGGNAPCVSGVIPPASYGNVSVQAGFPPKAVAWPVQQQFMAAPSAASGCNGNCQSCDMPSCVNRNSAYVQPSVLEADNAPQMNAAEEDVIEAAMSNDNAAAPLIDTVSLPKGMTGLIRPGDPLPPIPDEEVLQTAAKPSGAGSSVFGSTPASPGSRDAKASSEGSIDSNIKSKVMSETVRHLM